MRPALLAALAAALALSSACSSPPRPAAPAPGAGPAAPAPSAPAPNVPASTGPLTEEQFKAMHEPPATGEAPARRGRAIELAGTRAYLSVPDGPGPFPAVVVIHEWWGLNANIEHWADRLASAGWAALAVDLYGGVVATDRDTAMAAVKAVVPEKALGTIRAGLDFLASDPEIRATKRAVIGWCFGGAYSLQAAIASPDLDGAIIYYGQLETDPKRLAAIKARVLGIFGLRDRGIPNAEVDKFEAGLRAAGVRAEIHRYDAEHAFANPSNPKYDAVHASAAWERVLAFLGALRAG